MIVLKWRSVQNKYIYIFTCSFWMEKPKIKETMSDSAKGWVIKISLNTLL